MAPPTHGLPGHHSPAPDQQNPDDQTPANHRGRACRYGAHARNHGGHKVHVVSIKQERKRDSGQREDQKGQRGADQVADDEKGQPLGRGQHHRNKLLERGKGRMQAEEERYQELR